MTCVCVLFFGCTKGDYEGPAINNLYGDFMITDSFRIINNNPDFSIGEKVKFHCNFNKTIQWKITIVGLESNSKKTLTGFNNLIDSMSISWNGNTSQVPFFNQEICSLELTFENEVDTIRDTLTIAQPKIYEGTLVADFENGIPADAVVYHQFSMNMTFDVASDDPLEGSSYFKMGGRMGWNEWLLGQIDIPLDLSNINTNADNFYINLGVLSGISGEFATDQFVNILISESSYPFNDNSTNNGADVFQDTMEVYKYQIRPVDWVGWNMISVSYDDFEVKWPGGNNFREPKNITAIRLQCQSCPSASANCPENINIDVRTDIDYVIFTENSDLLSQ